MKDQPFPITFKQLIDEPNTKETIGVIAKELKSRHLIGYN
jgi:hypothetical protein